MTTRPIESRLEWYAIRRRPNYLDGGDDVSADTPLRLHNLYVFGFGKYRRPRVLRSISSAIDESNRHHERW